MNIQQAIPNIVQTEKPFIDVEQKKCAEEPYLAAFNWRWASQFAFYFPNQPRVFSLDFKKASYYSWRDDLKELAGCRFFVLGDETMYYPEEIAKVLQIESTQKFALTKHRTQKSNMVFIQGVLKDPQTLEQLQNKMLNHIQY